MHKAPRRAAALLAVCLLLAAPAAAEPYDAYSYNSYGQTVAAPPFYTVETVLTGQDMGGTPLVDPADMVMDGRGRLYILDSGNDRVVITDGGKETRVLDAFELEGEMTALNKAEGLFVDGAGTLYIADTGNNRVLRVEKDGRTARAITKPDSPYFGEGTEFLPTKVTADRSGNLYVLATGMYKGLVVFDNAFHFQGFYGSEMVDTTAKALSDFFWKQFMTAEQKEAMANYVPPEITNMFMGERDFLYTVTAAAYLPLSTKKTEMDSIRRLNPKGEDTLPDEMPEGARRAMELEARRLDFVDLCVDGDGFVTLADKTMGKIYHFDSGMNLLCAFGGLGDYAGAFRQPRAIETYGGKLYVLDGRKGSVTVFAPTAIGDTVHRALNLQGAGRYEEALEPWEAVLRQDVNSELACNGIGGALLGRHDYRGAMDYFRRGRNSVKYNEAFREYRLQAVRGGLPAILIGAAALAAGLWLYRNRRRWRGRWQKT